MCMLVPRSLPTRPQQISCRIMILPQSSMMGRHHINSCSHFQKSISFHACHSNMHTEHASVPRDMLSLALYSPLGSNHGLYPAKTFRFVHTIHLNFFFLYFTKRSVASEYLVRSPCIHRRIHLCSRALYSIMCVNSLYKVLWPPGARCAK
jgi:hypothetical protein